MIMWYDSDMIAVRWENSCGGQRNANENCVFTPNDKKPDLIPGLTRDLPGFGRFLLPQE
jgi:hypothetical protein